jgi:methylated-DNA-[protein]-cysteine S-methyltransferase
MADDSFWTALIAADDFALAVRGNDDALCEIRFVAPQPDVLPAHPLAAAAAAQLQRWLADPCAMPFDLPLVAQGSAFQQRVWAAITAIPCGKVRSYGELARLLASAPRAVGQACAANPYPLIVPCHRVVAAGGLGGFAGSREGFLPAIKRRLLAREGYRAAR